MAGDGTKVKLGICWVYYNGVDLGYTKGGVTLTVDTEVHEILVDQEGPAPIGAVIMGRRASCTVPLAETDYSRLNSLMPASTYSGGEGTLDIESGTGEDLLDYAKILRLHPKDEATEIYDIWMWKAAPVANLNFTMTADGEWVYPITFTGFVPEVGHPNAGVILSFGPS